MPSLWPLTYTRTSGIALKNKNQGQPRFAPKTLSGTIKHMQQAFPTYNRRADGAVVAGVAAGLAAHLRVNVMLVRATLAVLCVIGIGQWIYILLWLFTKSVREGAPIDKTHSSWWSNALLVVVCIAGASRVQFDNLPSGLFAAILTIAVGAALAWLAIDRMGSKLSITFVSVGAVLVLGGVLYGAMHSRGAEGFGPAVVAVALTLLGMGALVVPFVMRLWEKLAQERAEKVAANERAEIAAQLHDSVLQTLALIQKRAPTPEVQQLARRQERELRSWLFKPNVEETVSAAIERACGEVEDIFGVHIAPVFVGEDSLLDEHTKAAVLAAREAMVNAAKHAGVDTIDVYAEAFDGLSIYVRDRGPGFNLDDIAADRHGVRDSILGRVERAGGTAVIRNTNGTEVEIRMPADAAS